MRRRALHLNVAPREPGDVVRRADVREGGLVEERLYQVFTHPRTGARIFLSNLRSSQNEGLLRTHNIRAVVNACVVYELCNLPAYRRLDGIEYLMLGIDDTPDSDLTRAICLSQGFIDRHLLNGHNVLVHCQAGQSRSVSLIIAYLILHHERFLAGAPQLGEGLLEEQNPLLQAALGIILRAKPDAGPNLGFLDQLNNLANGWREFLDARCRVEE